MKGSKAEAYKLLIAKFRGHVKQIRDWAKAGAPRSDEQLGYHDANRAAFQREITRDINAFGETAALYEEQASIQKKFDRFRKEVSRVHRDRYTGELRLDGYTAASIIRKLEQRTRAKYDLLRRKAFGIWGERPMFKYHGQL